MNDGGVAFSQPLNLCILGTHLVHAYGRLPTEDGYYISSTPPSEKILKIEVYEGYSKDVSEFGTFLMRGC